MNKIKLIPQSLVEADIRCLCKLLFQLPLINIHANGFEDQTRMSRKRIRH